MLKTLSLASATLSGLQGALHDPEGQASIARWVGVAQQDQGYTVTLTAPLNMSIDNIYAGHRSHASHSSHRSHSSHSSHYSGSGGTYSTPPSAPAPYVAPRPPTPTRLTPSSSPYSTPASPYTATPQTLSPSTRPTTDQLMVMIMRVQAALYSRGYDPGAIDGSLGLQTRSALSSFQSAQGLSATGTMTTETLNALGVKIAP
jgi:His-Xaa-Ser repeat protein HxsA